MADVRSMLKASREARKINHPRASYTKDGKLMCNLCESLIKTESAWNSHLHSAQHTLRLSRAQDAGAARDASAVGKKRKATTTASPSPEERKKAKLTSFTPGIENEESHVEEPASPNPLQPKKTERVLGDGNDDDGGDDEVNVAELEALDKELAELQASMRHADAHDGAVISAPAMTAEEIAAQAREEQSAQRGKRDAEVEAEREDAARLMEDEFEAMEGFEERARKLREKREALRAAPIISRSNDGGSPSGGTTADEQEAGEEEDDSDDDGGFDDWKFGLG